MREIYSRYSVRIDGADGIGGLLPIGNGDICANVWIDPDYSLNLLVSKSDALSELTRTLKLGIVKISFGDMIKNPAIELVVYDGVVELADRHTGFFANIYVDANNPCICVDYRSEHKTDVNVEIINWRDRELVCTSSYHMENTPEEQRIESADVFVNTSDDSLLWYHRNMTSCFEYTLRNLDLENAINKFNDPILNLTFGALVYGDGLIKTDEKNLRSQAVVNEGSISIVCLAEIAESADLFIKHIREIKIQKNFDLHKKWWNDFFSRYYIILSGNRDAEVVSRGYILQKYVNACAGRGRYPIKFNGSLFTAEDYDYGTQMNYDYRRWGASYWIQNTRLIYWNMLYSGDFELIKPFFNQMMEILPLNEFSVREYFNHRGIRIPETYSLFGTHTNHCYYYLGNRDRAIKGETSNPFTRWHYNGMLEIAYMMLEYYRFTNDEKHLKEVAIPFTVRCLEFFDEHFERREEKLYIYPSQCLETWQNCANDAPNIAGLKAVTLALIEMLENDGDYADIIEFAKRIYEETPELTIVQKDGERVISPYQETFIPYPENYENGELYPVFPYRLYGIGKDDLNLAVNTFHKRLFKDIQGWQQNATFAALLGLTDEAQRIIVENFKSSHSDFKFPAFWGPNFDWSPDQTHGNQNSLALIFMILQCDGDIRINPAFPKEWTAEFRLPAPDGKIISGKIKNGEYYPSI